MTLTGGHVEDHTFVLEEDGKECITYLVKIRELYLKDERLTDVSSCLQKSLQT